MDNFNLRKYLTENKVTTNSRMVDEAGYVSPEGNLDNMPAVPSSGNSNFDSKFEELLDAASDSYGTGEKDLLDGVENVMNLSSHFLRVIEKYPDKAITTIIPPDSESNIAYLEALEAADAEDNESALQMMHDRAVEYWKLFMSDKSKKFFGFQ